MSTPWLLTLPQVPLLEGFKDYPVDTNVRSNFDGYNKVRRRFTASVRNVEEGYLLSSSQYADLINFYENTLGMGTEEFEKPDPLFGGTSTYRFTNPPEESAQFLGVLWRVTLKMEKLP